MSAKKVSSNEISTFLPKPVPPKPVTIQGKITIELWQEVHNKLQKDKAAGRKVYWADLIEAACKLYLSERTSK